MENFNSNPLVKIETVRFSGDSEVSFSPDRGGIITSIKLKGKEILYLDEATLEDRNVSVKGGVPILFPNAGPIGNSKYPKLKQHGFARNSSMWKALLNKDGFEEILIASKETMEVYPFNFRFSLKGKFEEDGSFTIAQEVENLGENEDLPLAMGLHPYFKIPQNKKGEIKFNFEGGKYIEEQVAVWANGEAVTVDNPKVKNPDAVLEVFIPDLGTLRIDVSPQYKKIWVWSMPGKDFFCVEPVMRDVGGLDTDPEMIKPKQICSTSVNFSL